MHFRQLELACRKKLQQCSEEIFSLARAFASLNSASFVGWNERTQYLHWENVFSVGLKDGEYASKNLLIPQPLALTSSRTAGHIIHYKHAGAIFFHQVVKQFGQVQNEGLLIPIAW